MIDQIPIHWKHAKDILLEFADDITNKVSFKKAKDWKHGRRVSFMYFYPDEHSFIKICYNRVKESSDFGYATTMGACGYVEIFLSDVVFEKQYKHLFSYVTHVIAFHELVHTLQHHENVMEDLTKEEKFAVSAELENKTNEDYFLELTNWEEMDASLAEYWFMHDKLPKSEAVFHKWYRDVHGLPAKLLKKVAHYIWEYFFNDNKNLQERWKVFCQTHKIIDSDAGVS